MGRVEKPQTHLSKMKECERLNALKKEIALDRKRLQSLGYMLKQSKAYAPGLLYINAAQDGSVFIPEIKKIRKLLNEKIDRSVVLYNKTLQFIKDIEDPWMKEVISLRCLKGLNWLQIALRIGGGNTEDAVKKAYYRFFERLYKDGGVVQ